MPELDLSLATGLQVANKDILTVRIANQDVWIKPIVPVVGDLMAAYNFNEASGPVLDYSGNGRHIPLQNADQRITSPTHEGLGAGGAGLVVAGGSSAWSSGIDMAPYNAALSRTMTFWGYLRSTGIWMVRWQAASADSGVFGVYYNSGAVHGRTRKGGTNYTASYATSLPTGSWIHFAVVYDGESGLVNLFGNGSSIMTASVPGGGLLDASQGIDIAGDGGNVGDGGINSFVVDSLRIYKRALITEEVVADMNTPVG